MIRWKIRGAVAGIAVVMVTVMSSGAATASTSRAITLNGDWAAFTRCPVDAAAMLAADGVRTSDECLASDSRGGTIKLGNTTATTGDSNLQLGVLVKGGTGSTTAVAPSRGAIAAAPVQIPGGLLGLMCPSNIPPAALLCDEIVTSALNKVTATIEPAGKPSNLDLAAGTTTGHPVVRIPVKVHLSNPLLGNNCFIGSNSHPIVLRPVTLVVGRARADVFDPNGTPDPNGPLLLFALSGSALGDKTFAVPGANGCGPLGIADPAIDLKTGLPSRAGNNRLILRNVTVSLAGYSDAASLAPHEGRALSNAWHSAVRG